MGRRGRQVTVGLGSRISRVSGAVLTISASGRVVLRYSVVGDRDLKQYFIAGQTRAQAEPVVPGYTVLIQYNLFLTPTGVQAGWSNLQSKTVDCVSLVNHWAVIGS